MIVINESFFVRLLRSRDETNLLQITINHVNVSNNQLADTSPTKIDPPFALVSQMCLCKLSRSREEFYSVFFLSQDDAG